MLIKLFSVLIVVTNAIQNATSEEEKSLTFVIDDTLSMGKVIGQVRRQVDGIIDLVTKTHVIDEFVLITFNDPDARVRKKTRYPDELKKSLMSIQVNDYDNYNCPECSLTGIELALTESNPESYIYVFTDASAADYNKVDKVKDLCKKTLSQVIFVLTGNCSQPNSDKYLVYYEIATASSGLVIEVDKDEVNLVLKSVDTFMQGKQNLITSQIISANASVDVPITIVNQTQFVIISIVGKNVKTKVQGPHSFTEQVIWTENCKMIQWHNPDSGNYTVHIKGASSTYVAVYVRTDFSFQYGFSQTELKTIEDCEPQPTANEDHTLSIFLDELDDSITINSAQILTMDEKVIRVLPLKKIGEYFFVSTLFKSPTHQFKIAVNGHVVKTGRPIRRLAKTPIEPQIVGKPQSIKPTVTIKEGPSITIMNGSTLILTCKVHGFSKMRIYWKDKDGTDLSTNSSFVTKPYKVISYLHLHNVEAENTYSCSAVNSIGRDNQNVNVKIGDPFKVLLHPQESILVKYGKSISLKCIITSDTKMKITWHYNNGAKSQKLFTSSKYTISRDGTELVIKFMAPELVGTYICNAALLSDYHIQKTFNSKVFLYGLKVPFLSKTTSFLYVQEHKAVTIPCPILKGLPKPEIKWQFSDDGPFVALDVGAANILNDGLYISKTKIRNNGKYKCIAENNAGIDEHITTLIVYKKPDLHIVQGTKINMKYGGDLKLECKTTIYPIRKHVWRLENGTKLSSYNLEGSLSSTEQTIVLELTNVTKSTTFYCDSENEEGIDTRAVAVIVTPPFKIINHDKVMNVSHGDQVNIHCGIKSDLPVRNTWYYMEKTTAEKKPLYYSSKYIIESNGAVLKILSMDLDLVGIYICEVSLLSHTHVKISSETKLYLTGKPKIEKLPTVIKVMENSSITIECKVIEGNPKPNIYWQFQKRGTYLYEPISAFSEVLHFTNTNLANFGYYKCVAYNLSGRDEQITGLIVEKAPTLTITDGKRIELMYGVNYLITCKVVAYPPPNIVWTEDEGNVLSSVKSPTENVDHVYKLSVEVKNIKKNKHLTCYASNIHGTAAEYTEIDVISPFEVLESPEAIMRVDYGKPHTIRCNITSYLQMKIQWYHILEPESTQLLIKSSDKYSISPSGAELTIKYMDLDLTGKYQCKASLVDDDNETVFYETILQISDLAAPEIIKATKIMRVNVDTNTTIPCSFFKGSPKPKIQWFFESLTDGEMQPINESGEILSLTKIQLNNTGYYLCIAQNMLGEDLHSTNIIVEAPPTIDRSANATTYNAIVGDTVLKLSCHATGFPKPIITWKVKGNEIKSGGKYSIVDGALLVYKPLENDTLKYTCIAKNSLGEDSVAVNVIVTSRIMEYQKVRLIRVVKGTSKKIHCVLPRTYSNSVRWFLNGDPLNKFAPSLYLIDVNETMEGNYSCRINTEHGSIMETYIVDVVPPKNLYSQDNSLSNWKSNGTLDCTEILPHATYGNESKHDFQLDLNIWKQYKCIVSDNHGSMLRDFNVTSSDCFINVKTHIVEKSPLLLTGNLKWPHYVTNNNLLSITYQDELILSCHSQYNTRNSFTIIPENNEVEAICVEEDLLWVEGKLYAYSDLHCEHEVSFSVKPTGKQCLGENSEIIQVGYELDQFVEVYRVCFDTNVSLPLYSEVTMISTNNFTFPPDYNWINLFNVPPRAYKVYNCENSSFSCCIGKEKLVSDNDVMFGPARRSTLIEYFNSVPVWNHCDNNRTTWQNIEDVIRKQYANRAEFKVWSGAAKYDSKDVPQYLWKVARFNDVESLAIVYVNDPQPNDSHVLCKDLCPDNIQWAPIKDKFTYCCELSEFLTTFNLPEDIIGGL